MRHIDNSALGRHRDYPIYHLFTQDMCEIGFTKFYEDRTLTQSEGEIMVGSIGVEADKSITAKRRLEAMHKIFKEKDSENLAFYRIKGSELDVEARKEVEDADVLNQAVKRDDEVRVHLFMFIISLLSIEVSALTVHDTFVINMLEALRADKFGWEPVYCSYEEGEAKFVKVLFGPIILHALVLIWVLTRTIRSKFCGIGDRTQRPCFLHPSIFIGIGNIIVIIVGYQFLNGADKEITEDRCKSDYSISATWFRMDFILTFLAIFEEFFDEFLVGWKEKFNLHYKCEYLHQQAHKRQMTGADDDMSLADLFKARIMSEEDNARLAGIDKKKSVRMNQPTANLVQKETILKNIKRAHIGYEKGLKLEDIIFENESEAGAQQQYEEFRDNIIEDSVKTLSIGGSIYEHAFWTMYHEDCPKVINETIQRCCFSMVVTLLLTYYILGARTSAVSETFYYGSW